MRKTILIALLLISVAGYSQKTAAQVDQQKKDSIELDGVVNDIVTKTPINELQIWFYKNIPAENYNEIFVPYYNAFIKAKYDAYLKTKQKPK